MRRRRRWFLPETPDVLGMLREQTAITVEGIDALGAWADGDPGAAERMRDCEHRADDRKRDLRAALSVAFTTPLEPEDVFELSRGLDRVLNNAKNAVREAELMQTKPDAAIAEMAAEIAEGTRHLADAFAALGRNDSTIATEAATLAAKSQSRLEHTYRSAMSGLIAVDDLREVAAKRELYRRLARASDDLRDVAERVWYSVLKES
jgi:Phosphate transport regulator (distant homolog of PhoU)